MGMVFQSYAIWPHMTVFENVAFPLQELRVARAEIRDRVMAILGTVGLGGPARAPRAHAVRRPAAAGGARAGARVESGGALAGRASSNSRRAAAGRDALRAARHAGQARDHQHLRDARPGRGDDALGSHRRHECRRDRAGRRAEDVYQRPSTRFVMDFLGRANHLPARVRRGADGGWLAEVEDTGALCPHRRHRGVARGPGGSCWRFVPRRVEARAAERGRRVGRCGAVVGVRQRPRRVRRGFRKVQRAGRRAGRSPPAPRCADAFCTCRRARCGSGRDATAAGANGGTAR